jgi:hypothetical protein
LKGKIYTVPKLSVYFITFLTSSLSHILPETLECPNLYSLEVSKFGRHFEISKENRCFEFLSSPEIVMKEN